jgi:hypothetical protein
MKNGVFWVEEPHGVTTQKTPFFLFVNSKMSQRNFRGALQPTHCSPNIIFTE